MCCQDFLNMIDGFKEQKWALFVTKYSTNKMTFTNTFNNFTLIFLKKRVKTLPSICYFLRTKSPLNLDYLTIFQIFVKMVNTLPPSTRNGVKLSLTIINLNLELKYDICHICKVFSTIGFLFYNNIHLLALAHQ